MKDFKLIYGTAACCLCCNCLLPFFLPASIIFSCCKELAIFFFRGENSLYVCIAESFYAFSIYSKFTALNRQQYCAIRIRTHKIENGKENFSFFLPFFFRFHFHSRGNFFLFSSSFLSVAVCVLLMFYN